MSDTLKIGFVGAGFISQFQMVAMQQMRGLEVAGVYSPNRAKNVEKTAQELGLGPGTPYPSVTELVKNVDIVAIYCANYVRLEVMEEIVAAVKAAAELKGLICEKPLGRTVAEAKRMVELANEINVNTSYFENQLHMRAIQSQRNQLAPQAKTMGPLMLTRCAEEHSGPHEPWFWDPTRQGGGVLSDMGCHSIAVGWYCLTPIGKPLTFLEPVSVQAETALLKWGQPMWRERLKEKFGVDYAKTPAEDFTTGLITFKNPETGQYVKTQFTNSWMFEKQGLRLFMDGMGPGYAFELNSLISPLNIFIGDEAAEAVADAEKALEKSTASRGLLSVQYNEADLYGYTSENVEALAAFQEGRDGMMSLSYGLEITKLVQAAYMAAERRKTIDLTDPAIQKELESYVPAIAQGNGADVLF